MSITHVGPTKATFTNLGTGHSASGRMLALAVAADNTRMYAGCYAGVWRSDDAGRTWRQLTRPQPFAHEDDVPGALFAGTVFDLAISPVDRDLVLASGSRGRFVQSRDGIYRSTDGGENWTRVLTVQGTDFVSQIVFAPDDPQLVFAAIGSAVAVSHNAGASWVTHPLPSGLAWHVAVAPLSAGNPRRVYAVGSGNAFCSLDGGTTWVLDTGASVVSARAGLGGGTADNSGSGANVLAVDPSNPRCVFLAAAGGANGPSYYAQRPDGSLIADGTICNTTPDRGCGEGSIWYGDYTQFATTHAAVWQQLPGPPVYWGVTSPSGNSFLQVKPTASGFLIFFADESHVHVCVGKPASHASWHRLDGKDASQTKLENDLHNRIFVHPDPHAIAVTSDFNLTLKPPTGVTAPYDQNSVLDQHLGGTIWMANDGGVYVSSDGGQTWTLTEGLETLDPVNIAGVAGIGPAPALYFGCGDNDDFFSRDGGQTWGDPSSFCGDCDAWFADIAEPTRLLQFDPPSRNGKGFRLRKGAGYPDAATNAGAILLPAPRNNNVSSGFVERGYRPLIRTLATELPLPDGDVVVIGANPAGERILVRTTAMSTISTVEDWDDPIKAPQIGPVLPAGVDIVQASGGHSAPVYYVGNASELYKLDPGGTQWIKLVPGGPPNQRAEFAGRFFVSPFDPALVYVLDQTAVKVSIDGGASWQIADSLTRAVTAGHRMTLDPATALMDMVFVRSDPLTVFVFGHAGVSYTVDGVEWRLLLSALAMPGCPEFGFFDGLSDPNHRALYVSLKGRGILRIDPILPRLPSTDSPPFSLMELAGMIES